MSAPKSFNVGIVGYGLSAKIFHIPFIAHTPSLRLHSIVQRNPTPTNSAPQDHPSLKHHTTPDSLLADPEVHVVVICTPPDTHFRLAQAALSVGKHVIVEKPFVPTSSEASSLAALAREGNLVLSVYQNRRWDSDFLTVQHLISSGTLGRVVELTTHFDRFRPAAPAKGSTWKASLATAAGGGILYDLGSHLLDQAFVLFGLPTAVYGRLLNQREGRDVSKGEGDNEPDGFVALLRYEETGLVVEARASIMSAEKTQPRFWVRGTKGSYRKLGLDPQEGQLRESGRDGVEVVKEPIFGREDESKFGKLCRVKEDGSIEEVVYPTVEPTTYLEFYKQFAKALESGKQEDGPVPASEAAQVLRIVEAIRESARTGREVAP